MNWMTITLVLFGLFGAWQAAVYIDTLSESLDIAVDTLAKISDPRLRDHQEPDTYTELGCVMNMADEGLTKIHEVMKRLE